MKKIIAGAIVLLIGCMTAIATTGGETMVIEKGRIVSFDYVLTVEDRVVDSSKERGPLTYTHGEGRIVPGLARQLEGLKAGDEKKIIVEPQEGYGPVDPQAVQEVPKTQLPQDIEPKPGMALQARTDNGTIVPVLISNVKEDSVVLDLNHPLAGKTLQFDVKIQEIK